MTDPRRLFVGQLPLQVVEADLRAYFGRYGVVDEVRHFRPDFKSSYAFVVMRTETSANSILRRDHRMHGELLNVRVANPRQEVGNGAPQPPQPPHQPPPPMMGRSLGGRFANNSGVPSPPMMARSLGGRFGVNSEAVSQNTGPSTSSAPAMTRNLEGLSEEAKIWVPLNALDEARHLEQAIQRSLRSAEEDRVRRLWSKRD